MQDTNVAKVVQLTAEGYEELQQELKELTDVKLPAVIERVAKAREYGDLAENAEYQNSREDQTLIETRIDEIEKILANAQVVQQTHSTTKIGMGSTVVVMIKGKKAKITLNIVGEFQAAPASGKVSSVSPLGLALVGKKKGDIVKVAAPAGEVIYEILDIK